MKIGECLIDAIQAAGVRHVFGIQGDYVLRFYEQLSKSPLALINTCDEQGAGFAADAYARMAGFGVVCVTYGVGGLKLVNSTAQAFAESSPVLVISGAPGVFERQGGDALLHHKVRSFETQLNVFREMTVAQAVLDDAESAATEIDRVIDAISRTKRPGYIELPRDMLQLETGSPRAPKAADRNTDRDTLEEAIREVVEMIVSSKRPVVVAGAEIHRFGLQQSLLAFLMRSGLPFATTVLGKSVISENHPQFIGVYEGSMCPDHIREAVEGSDCILLTGSLLTDIDTGIFTHNMDPGKTIAADAGGLRVKHHLYQGIRLKDFLESVTSAMPQLKEAALQPAKHVLPHFVPEAGRAIKVERLFACINAFLDDDTTVIAELGNALFGAADLHIHGATEFLGPSYYASLGFAVPASIGVQLASPDRRPLVLVGDGAFQMSGMELSTSVRYGLSPIVVILNNGGYGTFRPIIDGPFNDIQPWHYADIVRVIGAGTGYTVTKEDELTAALEAAKQNRTSPTIIDVRLDKYDCSPASKRLTDGLRKRIQKD